MMPRLKKAWMPFCISGSLAYAIYSSFNESGLSGYLIQLQIQVFRGEENVGLTLFGTWFGVLLPLLLLGRLANALLRRGPASGPLPPAVALDPVSEAVRQTLSRPATDMQFRAQSASDANERALAALRHPGEPAPQPIQPVEPVSKPVWPYPWKTAWAALFLPIALGAVLYPIAKSSNERDRRATIYAVDLTSGSAAFPEDARFVRVTGVLARSFALTFKKHFPGPGSRTSSYRDDLYEIFAPLTGVGWTPADPVRYFVRHEVEAYPHAQWPGAFRVRGAAQFSGKLSPSLPWFAENHFRSQGLKLAPPYTVIEWKDLPVEPSDPVGAWIILTGLGALFFSVVLVSSWVFRRKMEALQKKDPKGFELLRDYQKTRSRR